MNRTPDLLDTKPTLYGYYHQAQYALRAGPEVDQIGLDLL